MKQLLSITNPNTNQQKALKKLETLGLPTKKNEEYRYFDIENILSKEWERFEANTQDIKESQNIIIHNGVVVNMPKDKGIILEYSSEIDIDEEHFDPIYYLGHTLNKTHIKIRFTKDCRVVIRHINSINDKFISYRTALYFDKNVKVDIVEFIEDLDTDNSLMLLGSDIFVSSKAEVSLVRERTAKKNGLIAISSDRVNVDKNALFSYHTFDFGDGKGLNLVKAKLDEEAKINSYHLLFARDKANIGNISKIIHAGKNSKSTQKAKNILQGVAKGIFDALIKINNLAPKSITHQNSQAILLNDGAFMASKPQLEIYIDDVEASHGSTIGELDADQLFYLRSRGINKENARKLLILAFANEMIDVIEDKLIRETLHCSFDKVYHNKPQVECIATCHHCEEMVLKEDS